MSVIKTKPTSPGRRFVVKIQNPGLHKGDPYGPLVVSQPKSTGRNCHGRITMWRRGGGHKRLYRIIDWTRSKIGVKGQVKRFEYDPNRSANIALISYQDGDFAYIIAPQGLKVGQQIMSGPEAPVAVGNCLPLRHIPVGTTVHCVELLPGKGAKLARSAGCSVQVLAKEGEQVTLRLKSNEMRYVPLDCVATIGEVGNSEHNLRKLGKAGASRWRNRRPNVRGVAMNPVDHPLGGGEGRTSGGRPPCTPWGKREGIKTRRNKRTNKMIIRRRNQQK